MRGTHDTPFDATATPRTCRRNASQGTSSSLAHRAQAQPLLSLPIAMAPGEFLTSHAVAVMVQRWQRSSLVISSGTTGRQPSTYEGTVSRSRKRSRRWRIQPLSPRRTSWIRNVRSPSAPRSCGVCSSSSTRRPSGAVASGSSAPGELPRPRGEGMRKGDSKRLPEGHPDRYDWSKATRGKHATRAAKASVLLRILDPELARKFPDSRSVNAALRGLLALQAALPRRRGRRAHAA